jgi:L-rhamnose isomerase
MSVIGYDPTENNDEVKEYTVEEIYEMYCQVNNIPDELYNYIDYLEAIIKRQRNELDNN